MKLKLIASGDVAASIGSDSGYVGHELRCGDL